MSMLLKIRLLIAYLFSLSVALWTPYILSLIYFPMPHAYVLFIASMGVLAVTMGTVIGIKLLKHGRH